MTLKQPYTFIGILITWLPTSSDEMRTRYKFFAKFVFTAVKSTDMYKSFFRLSARNNL